MPKSATCLTGVLIDVPQLLAALRLAPEVNGQPRVVLDQKGIGALSAFLHARQAMYLTVYGHPQEYLIRHLEGDDTNLSIGGEPQLHLVVLVRDDLHLCQQTRQARPTLPLVMVSENISERHIANALDVGADDYVTIPFGEGEFLARMRALVLLC